MLETSPHSLRHTHTPHTSLPSATQAPATTSPPTAVSFKRSLPSHSAVLFSCSACLSVCLLLSFFSHSCSIPLDASPDHMALHSHIASEDSDSPSPLNQVKFPCLSPDPQLVLLDLPSFTSSASDIHASPNGFYLFLSRASVQTLPLRSIKYPTVF